MAKPKVQAEHHHILTYQSFLQKCTYFKIALDIK